MIGDSGGEECSSERGGKKAKSLAKDDGAVEGDSKRSNSYKDTLIDANPKKPTLDSRGSSVFEDAWKGYIDGLKEIFGDGHGGENKAVEGNQGGENGGDVIPNLVVTKEQYERWCAPWRKSLIVRVMGKNVSLWTLQSRLNRIWKTKRKYLVRDIGNGYFVISFDNEEDMSYVYLEGPWMVADRYLLVQQWRPNFDPWNAGNQRRIAAWIRIPILPLEFFNAESLALLGGLVGKTLKVDSITYLTERGRFARICVELDLQKKLVPAIRIFGKERRVEYEGLHMICFSCGKYGHHRDLCTESGHVGKDKVKKKGEDPVSSVHQKVGESNPGESTDRPEQELFQANKRGRELQETEAPVESQTPAAMALGVWNLVKRPVRKKMEGANS